MRALFTILFIFVGSSLFSNNNEKIIVVNDNWVPLNLNEYTYSYSTKERDLNIDDVLKEGFTYMPSGLNIGLNDKVYWVKFNIRNTSDCIKDYYIFFPYNHINKIDAYAINNDSVKHIKSAGTYYSDKNKDLLSRGYPILISLKPGLTSVVIKVEHLYLPLRGIAFLLNEEQVIENTLKTQALLSFWQGIMLLVLLLTSVLYIVLRIKSLLYYFLLNLGILLFFNAEVGDFFLIIDRDQLDNIIDIKHFANILVLIFLPLFINEIASISKARPVLWKIMMYGVLIGPIAWAICLIPIVKDTYFLYYTTLYFIVYSAVIFILIIYLTYSAYRKKYKNALIVFIIYLFYFSASFVNLILPNLGIMDSGLLVYNSFIYGSLFEITAFLGLIGNEILSVYNQRSNLLEKQKNHQAEIIKAIVESQEKERNKVGRELHDMIGANISVIKQQVDKTNTTLISVIERTIDSVRNLSHGLVTPLIKDDEFVDEINELCVLSSGLDLTVKSHFHNWTKIENPERATHLYRIIQELLQNAVKHSKAHNVLIQFIINKENELTVMYEDDGIGFDYESAFNNKGLGLMNIDNRIKLIGSTVVYDTMKNGKGTTVTIIVPC